MTNEKFEAKLQQANDELHKGNYYMAEHLASDVLTALDSDTVLNNNDYSHRAESILILAKINLQRGNYILALEQVYQAHTIAEEYSLSDALPKALNLLGSVYRLLGNYSQSLDYFSKALAYQEKIGAKAGVASVWGSIGVVYQNLGNYTQALDYLAKALAVHEVLGDKFSVAKIRGNIGVVYQNLRNYEKALEYYGKTLSSYEELGQKPGIANVMGNIGTVYFSLDNYDMALEYLFKALVRYEELGEKSQVARITGSLGSAYFQIGNYTKSLEYLFKAHAVLSELGKKDGLAIVTGNIGELYASQTFEGYNPELAEEYLLKSINLCEELGVKHNLYTFHLSLSAVYKNQEKWKEAHIQYVKYNELKEEVQNEEATKQAQLMEHRRKIEESERDRQVKLARFQEQEKILHNILPSQIADRMIEGEKTIVDSYESVSVLFADIVGFTKLSQRVTPEQLVAGLDGIFNTFDQLADKHGCEKIKTIGDCYMVVAGLPERCDDHAERLGVMALEMLKAIEELPALVENISINMRIGIHSGSVVAGIIGKNKYAYDLWGDAVNTASRMESHGEAGKIHCSEEFMRALSPLSLSSFHFQDRGQLDIKGKGMMKTYFLEGK